MPGKNVPAIKVNTVGYEVGWKKIAIFNVEPKQAILKDAASGKTVLAIEAKQVTAKGTDAASQDPVWQVDFSAFDKPGNYKLASGGAESDVFEIGKNLYRTAVVAGLKSFYFQRCRTALVEPFAAWEGKSYLRKGACHDHDDVGWDLVDHPEQEASSWKNEGGWHDAGNFDMYIPSTAVAAQTLLLAYEWAPALFPDKQLNIPESGNGASDLLDETKFGLIWILSMQEPERRLPPPRRDDRVVARGAGRQRQDRALGGAPVQLVDGQGGGGAGAGGAAVRQGQGVRRPLRRGGQEGLGVAAGEPRAPARQARRRRRAAAVGRRAREQRRGRALRRRRGDVADVPRRRGAEEGPRRRWPPPRPRTPRRSWKAPGSTSAASACGPWPATTRRRPSCAAEAKKRLLAAAELMRPRVEKNDGYRCASALDDYYWASNSNLMEKLHVLMMAARLDPAQQLGRWRPRAISGTGSWGATPTATR